MHFAIENWNRRLGNGLLTSSTLRRQKKIRKKFIRVNYFSLASDFLLLEEITFSAFPLKFFFFYNVRKPRFNMAWPKIFSFSLITNEKILKMMIEPGEIAWVGSHLQNFNREIIHYNQRLRNIIELPYKAISSATFEFRALSVTFQIDFSWCNQAVMILIESRAADFLDKIKEEVTILRVCELKFRHNFPGKLF